MRWLLSAILLALLHAPTGARAQPTRPTPLDSVRALCIDVDWLDPTSICSGRLANAATSAMVGAAAGAMAGFVGAAVFPTGCIGNGETAAVRGAIAGGGLAFGATLLARHVSRRTLAARGARAREHAAREPIRPWSWRDVRPAFAVVGTAAAGGALIGLSQGLRSPSPCGGGVGPGVAQGAAVFAAGSAATIGGALLVVRFLF